MIGTEFEATLRARQASHAETRSGDFRAALASSRGWKTARWRSSFSTALTGGKRLKNKAKTGFFC